MWLFTKPYMKIVSVHDVVMVTTMEAASTYIVA